MQEGYREVFADKGVSIEAELMGEITRNKTAKQSRRSVTPTLEMTKNKSASRIAPSVKTPTMKSRSKSKVKEANPATREPKEKKQLATSKYFRNIFGEATALEYFKVNEFIDSPSKASKQPPDFLKPQDPQNTSVDGSPLKSLAHTVTKKAQSERNVPSLNQTAFDIIKENSQLYANQSPAKNLFKTEIYNLSKDQCFDLLIKTSEIAQKIPHLKSNLAQLVSQLPLQQLHFQNLKHLYKVVANKGGHSAAQFHQKCDGLGPYLGFVIHSNGIFGFFVENNFADEFEVYSKSKNSMIFTLKSHLTDRFTCFKVKNNKEQFALCNTEEGFCMGMPTPNHRDLLMDFDDLSKCSSHLGFAYEAGDYPPDALAGKYANWNIVEIEILQVVTKHTMLKTAKG